MRIDLSPFVQTAIHVGQSTVFGPAQHPSVQAVGVDGVFFRVLGLTPEVGRTLETTDAQGVEAAAGAPDVPVSVVIEHDVATRLFGNPAAALGVHDLDGRRVDIVGVMRPGVKFPDETVVWTPLPSAALGLPAYVLLRSGASAAQLEAGLAVQTPAVGSSRREPSGLFRRVRPAQSAGVGDDHIADGRPGGEGAAGMFSGPLDVGLTPVPVAVESFDSRPCPDVVVRVNEVSLQFVRPLGAQVVAGRDFDRADIGTDAVLANLTLARQLTYGVSGLSAGGAVINGEIRTEVGRGRIVGVVRDFVQTAPAIPAGPEFFRLRTGADSSFAVIAVRVSPDAIPAVKAILAGVWGSFPPGLLTRLDGEKARVLEPYRSDALLLTLLSVMALPISVVGLLGAVAYAVRLRVREIAVRLALGAQASQVRRAIVARSLRTVVLGVAVGIAGGTVAGAAIASHLFGVRPADPWTAFEVGCVFVFLSWATSSIAAARAARLNPASLLRSL